MKPIINFVLRSLAITINQDMVMFNEFLDVEKISEYIKNKTKNDKR